MFPSCYTIKKLYCPLEKKPVSGEGMRRDAFPPGGCWTHFPFHFPDQEERIREKVKNITFTSSLTFADLPDLSPPDTAMLTG
jgi:hypothetical protein